MCRLQSCATEPVNYGRHGTLSGKLDTTVQFTCNIGDIVLQPTQRQCPDQEGHSRYVGAVKEAGEEGEEGRHDPLPSCTVPCPGTGERVGKYGYNIHECFVNEDVNMKPVYFQPWHCNSMSDAINSTPVVCISQELFLVPSLGWGRTWRPDQLFKAAWRRTRTQNHLVGNTDSHSMVLLPWILILWACCIPWVMVAVKTEGMQVRGIISAYWL